MRGPHLREIKGEGDSLAIVTVRVVAVELRAAAVRQWLCALLVPTKYYIVGCQLTLS